MKVLVIPDTHSEPGVSGERFDWIGNAILSERPDVVVHLGDHWDYRSIGKYDKGKLSGEGARYGEEREKGWEDFKRITDPVRRAKKRLPRLIFCEGNHEHRETKYAADTPELSDVLRGSTRLLVEDLGWEWHPFLRWVTVGGVNFSHYFVSGKMGNPCSSPAVALNRHGASLVYGHGHTRTIAYTNSTVAGERFALEAGVFCQHAMSYAGPQVHEIWWRGLHILHDVHDGSADVEPIEWKRVVSRWS